MPGDFGTIVQIGDTLVSEDVLLEFFCCDYDVCKGECCISGDAGAPLDEDELENLEKNYPTFSPLMLPDGRISIDTNGFFVLDREGDIVTPLTEGSAACAYAHFSQDGSCLCAIEKCGCTKPRSCSLYPIRVTRFKGGGEALNLHRWNICKCAFEKGRREGIRVFQFLREPLIASYGEEFFEALEAAYHHISDNNTI